jgi:hypothetical protein
MPYYHAVAVIVGKHNHRWWNRSKDNIIGSILWPYLNGQVIIAKYNRKPSLLNLGVAKYLRIFRTAQKISGQSLKLFLKNSSIGTECTSEFIKEMRFDKASEDAKSLLQKIALPPKHQIFVVMKFDDRVLDSAYEGAIKPVGREFGYNVLRIDEVENSGRIDDQIMNAIAESEIVLSDLSGSRPNCYFETGVAIATGRELILTIHEDEEQHFDLKQNRFIKWGTEQQLRERLRTRLQDIRDR